MLFHKMNTPNVSSKLSRRSFLAASGGMTAGLIVGFGSVPNNAAAAVGSAADGAFNPFVSIAPDGTVTVLSKHLDKGQGTLTGLAVLVAEELDADWSQMRGDHAPANAETYKNFAFGMQGTGGSTGVPNSFMQYRQAGAAARAMLVAAAAKEWSVPAEEITVKDGTISHASGRSAGFGELAAAASSETPPAEPVLKDPLDFKLIGNPGLRRLDSAAKTRGEAVYTQDMVRPGMLYAVLARPPKFGGKVVKVDDSAARAVPGVEDIVTTPGGVAVLANGTWAALQGREALDMTWDFSTAETRSTPQLLGEYRALAEQPGLTAVEEGDIDSALSQATQVIEATYEFPYLSHAPMEPMNAVVELTPGKSLEIWTGSQLQTLDQMNVAPLAGIEPHEVKINTLFAGGSFGRRTMVLRTTLPKPSRSLSRSMDVRRSNLFGRVKMTSRGGTSAHCMSTSFGRGSTRMETSWVGTTASSDSRSCRVRLLKPF
jgi:isoquinoline 1-oxidoreductase beta subunit